jgi:kynurenine formamidase
MRRLLLLLFPVFVLCAQIDPQKLVDLTWSYDEKTIYWPTAKPFQFEKESWGVSPGGYWYSAGRYSASEHGGTHLDSPIHFAKDQIGTDQIPLNRLVAPAVVIDVRKACDGHPDYLVTAADLTAWEKGHGAIPRGSVAIIHTGWGRFWPDKKRYLGTDKAGDVAGLHFPGIGKDAAELLKSRGIAGVGIDTASVDYGQSKDFITHQILNGAGIYGLENVAYLEKVPAKGATLIALPMKIAGGSGGPVRLIALLP